VIDVNSVNQASTVQSANHALAPPLKRTTISPTHVPSTLFLLISCANVKKATPASGVRNAPTVTMAAQQNLVVAVDRARATETSTLILLVSISSFVFLNF